ncbi:DNA-binding protein [Nocardioides mangrovicus]|uniref:DNA-binding protein n=1 Tax=Nocardioides mangrovicus TaxID=2478913 RepID=A0A3L8NXN7_9ACTN|nr:DNA-binding protein [Nocardioides mangrovicus]
MARSQAWTPESVRALGVQTDLPTAASVLGVGRTTAYELNRRGQFPVPVIQLGRRFIVPTAPLLQLLAAAEA